MHDARARRFMHDARARRFMHDARARRYTMSSIFIGKNKQKELLANQVAIAIALGDFQDDKSHSALDFTNSVTFKMQDEKFKNCEGNYQLDENALAKGFEIFKGTGKSGPIECLSDVEKVTEVKNWSKDPSIATPAFGIFPGSTSSFYRY